MHASFVILALALAAAARPTRFERRADFTLKNGQDAIALNDKFKTLTADSPCNAGDNACVNNSFAQCVGGKFVLTACAGGGICAALPLVNSAGTSITCTTQADLDARIAATGATAAAAPPAADPAASSAAAAPPPADTAAATPPPASAGDNAAAGGDAGGDPQASTQLSASVIQNFDDGQNPPVTGQSAATVSKNNFINFCLTNIAQRPITNGLQISSGSCNPTPIGNIPSVDKMPSAKFQSPKNLDTLTANTAFNITLKVNNIQLGKFTNAQKTYFGNPQDLNEQGQIIGHTHVVIEAIDSLTTTTVSDPTKFIFFKGVNDAQDAQGNVVVPVAAGVPAGAYRLSTINSASTHQPVIVPVAQHGSLDDMVYFTVA